MFKTKTKLPRDQILELLKRNPPELFTALSNAVDDCTFNNIANKTAKDMNNLISEIKQMDINQLEKLLIAVQKYVN